MRLTRWQRCWSSSASNGGIAGPAPQPARSGRTPIRSRSPGRTATASFSDCAGVTRLPADASADCSERSSARHLGDWTMVSLPTPLWPAYSFVRPARLVLERIGRRDAHAAGLGPFLSTPHSLIPPLFELVGLGPDDTLLDIGCGDGRIAIAAAQSVGCRSNRRRPRPRPGRPCPSGCGCGWARRPGDDSARGRPRRRRVRRLGGVHVPADGCCRRDRRRHAPPAPARGSAARSTSRHRFLIRCRPVPIRLTP